MAKAGQVHWYESLFLQPHHLQLMQRSLMDQTVAERQLSWAYPYGMIECKVSADELANMRVRFDRLRVVLPSGVVVDVPDGAELPSLDIKGAFEASSGAFLIYLGVPLWVAHRANSIENPQKDDWRTKRIYLVEEISRPDENTGENPQAIRIRKVNARLLLESDDHSDMEVFPLLKIAHAAGEDVGLPRQDASFVPACLILQGSPILRDMVRDLANQAEASRKELVIQINRGGFAIDQMRGLQFEQMLRLRTLAGFSGRLMGLVTAPAISPFGMYLELRQLLGELAALRPDRDQFDAADYDHDNPLVAFSELCGKIRSLLRGVVAARFLQVAFALEAKTKVLAAALTDEHVKAPNEYFLGVRAKEDAKAISSLLEDADKFKVMPLSLAQQRVWGVKVIEERYPPLELPSQAGLHYFRLVRSESVRMWERIAQEKTIAIRFPGVETTDWNITLYMTLAEGEAHK
jgi:type VI secretion system ImpJ/VasE family protein